MRFTMSNLSLKRRIFVAIALISLIPLIILFYYFAGYYIIPAATVILTVIIFLGWSIIFDVFKAIIQVYAHSKNTLEYIGESAPSVPDEVQSLEKIISLLSDKVKSGFEELKSFTKMTEKLNREVSRTVLTLSTVLQANDLFSKDAPAEEVISFITNHLKQPLGVNICFCALEEGASSKFKVVVADGLDGVKIKEFVEEKSADFLRIKKLVVLDKLNKSSKFLSWSEQLSIKNVAIVPIFSKEQIVGILGVGNNEESFVFKKDDLDVLNLFSQNITLIWEHERLTSKIDELEIVDYLTGLYNEKMIIKRLNEEIKRATVYQRPCGFVSIEIKNYSDYREKFGLIEAERILKKMAKTLKQSLRTIDIPARIGPNALGAILIESNRRLSQEVADKIQISLKEVCDDKINLKIAVAESPINGITAKDLIQFALNQK